ncbi:hypothetical protein [Actinokineospora fastidiosa]|uniref:Xylulose 5-phosphate/Fructose 6-phosphate phosphoketolase N-terminal domain-containing protein n=1 Tax=Actinokineospora fastidiosa TaxID=1816 RepID=A0A918GCL6_9PSEU|nr:hypothetical protein [Actinokineospora fastidiosa]GGS28441.1 hypothetical protein GCM10010171_21900 [Actinokineospora fastidiosa]
MTAGTVQSMSIADLRPGDPVVRVDAWWRAVRLLSVGQVHLLDNPLAETLRSGDVTSRLRGHRGSVSGATLTCAHLNRVFADRDGEDLPEISGWRWYR